MAANHELRERLALVRDAIKPIKAFEGMAATVQQAIDALSGDPVAWANVEEGQLVGLAFNRSDAGGCTEPLYRGAAAGIPPELAKVGELVRTQDNRITSHPVFVIEQKRLVVTEDDYADGHRWYDPRGLESYDDEGKLRRDHERAADGESPIQWQRYAVKETWEFVTACFTEQGCKDYIACNGHNLREHRIYAYSAWRNHEWQRLREFLASLPPPATAAGAPA